uniref:Uncharacterized protein n=1 Tax=Anguilla anguilla TaxID=7936 RepID=A0A0E9WHJ7_ANGAN
MPKTHVNHLLYINSIFPLIKTKQPRQAAETCTLLYFRQSISHYQLELTDLQWESTVLHSVSASLFASGCDSVQSSAVLN